jgi:hypothetical protein
MNLGLGKGKQAERDRIESWAPRKIKKTVDFGMISTIIG